MRFSERVGAVPGRAAIQLESIDEPLRNKLWNALELTLWPRIAHWGSLRDNDYGAVIVRAWLNLFKLPLDQLDDQWSRTKQQIRNRIFERPWYEVFDLIEFIAGDIEDSVLKHNFVKLCNRYLEEELSAYRIVGDRVAEITREEEIQSIEEALASTTGLAGVNLHLRDSLGKLTDRVTPDYRNSIKESISAVEAMCRLVSGQPKATLGQALKKLKDRGVYLHPALESAWSSLYGYTSDEGGIRHALMDAPSVSFAEAKYMLVSCAAFVGYLTDLSRQAGIAL